MRTSAECGMCRMQLTHLLWDFKLRRVGPGSKIANIEVDYICTWAEIHMCVYMYVLAAKIRRNLFYIGNRLRNNLNRGIVYIRFNKITDFKLKYWLNLSRIIDWISVKVLTDFQSNIDWNQFWTPIRPLRIEKFIKNYSTSSPKCTVDNRIIWR